MPYISPTLSAGVTLTKCNIPANNALPIGAQKVSFYYSTTLKVNANESVNTDAFWINDDSYLATVFVTDDLVNYVTIPDRAFALGLPTTNILVKADGVYANGVKLATYNNVYVDYPADAMGAHIIFNMRAFDNVNGLYGDAANIASVNLVPVTVNLRTPPTNTLFTGANF